MNDPALQKLARSILRRRAKERRENTYVLYRCPDHPSWITTSAGAYCPHYHGTYAGKASFNNRIRHPATEQITVREIPESGKENNLRRNRERRKGIERLMGGAPTEVPRETIAGVML